MPKSLEAVKVTKRFGGLKAADEASLSVRSGELVALIGPNGAGKTTLLNALAGSDTPSEGSIKLNGEDITGWGADRRANAGIRRTFQHARPFQSMSLLEGTMVSLGASRNLGVLGGVFRTPAYHKEETEVRLLAQEALERVGLGSAGMKEPSSLTAGQQRLAELARAYVARPAFLLLDEPTSGLTSGEADHLFKLLDELKEEGLGLLVVEHRVRTVAEFADQMVVMDQGRVVASGPTAEVRSAKTVLTAYLGEQDA